MKVAVVIASVGRPAEVGHLLERLAQQTRPPSAVVLSVGGPADLPSAIPAGVQVIQGPKGLPAQRNRGLDALDPSKSDVVVFYDDDFVPAFDALERFGRVFADNADVVGVTGRVLADGITTAGVGKEEAVRVVDTAQAVEADMARLRDTDGLYGCNMAFRLAAVGATRFDERLPLYAWQEDTDFSRRLLDRGRLVECDAILGVHRGVKGGRNSGVKFGWSQIVNPIYLVRKGSMPRAYAARLICKNLAANHVRVFKPEPWVDRWGRVRGNWKGIRYVLSGKLDPADMAKLT
jgi:GT2 family glycosyltransferase